MQNIFPFILKSKIKSFFTPIFDSKNKERGFVPIVALVWGIGKAAFWIGTATYVYVKGRELMGNNEGSFYQAIILGVGNIIFSISAFLSSTAVQILSAVTNLEFLKQSITQEPIFLSSWSTVRDFSNMFIVLGFIAVGIAFALRMGELGSKKILTSLVLVALLINFSPILVGIAIDASNITTGYFTATSGGATALEFDKAINNVIKDYIKSSSGSGGGGATTGDTAAPSGDPVMNQFSAVITAAFFCLLIAYTYLVLSALFIARYAMLIILFVLSPLAFVCFIFPFTKKYWSMWWEQLLNWSFIGVSLSFFLYISYNMLIATTTASGGSVNRTLMDFLMPCVFLIVGCKVAKKTSAMGASAVMGLATGAAGFAMGAAGKAGMSTLKGLANKTGISKGVNAVKTGATRLGEKLDLVAPGTSAGMEAKRLEEPKKRLGNFDSKRLATIATQSAWSKKANEDKAAAAVILAERKDLNEISDENARAAAMAHAVSFQGVKPSDFTNSDYRMAGHDDKKATQYIADHPMTNGAPTDMNQARRALRQQQLENNWSSMSRSQRRDVDMEDIDAPFISRVMSRSDIKAFATAPQPKIDAFKESDPVTGTGLRFQLSELWDAARARGDTREQNRLFGFLEEIEDLPG